MSIEGGRLVGTDEGAQFAVAGQKRGLFVFVEITHEVYKTASDVLAHPVHEVDALAGDLDHHFAAVFAGVEALDVAKLFQAVHQARGRSGAVTHLFRDVGHGEEVLVGKVAEEEKLGEGNVSFVQFLGEVKEEGTLGEHDKVSQASSILPDEGVFFFYCLHR